MGTPLGYVMWACYALVQNVGWAIIIFTLITRAAMFPLNLKQQKNMAISQLYMPRVKEIQTKYKNDRERQQEELMKLQKEGYNPTGGCLPMLLTFVILFGVIDVVYKPMTHMEHFDNNTITSIVTSAKKVDVAETLLTSETDYNAILEYLKDDTKLAYSEWDETGDDGKTVKKNNRNTVPEGFSVDNERKNVTVTAAILDTLEPLYENVTVNDKQMTRLEYAFSNSSKLSDAVRTSLQMALVNYNDSTLYRELRALNCYGRSKSNAELIVSRSGIDSTTSDRLEKLSENIIFMGINLGDQPKWAFDILLVIPVLAFILSMAQMLIQQRLTEIQNPEMAKQQGSMKFLFITMPFISLFIAFSVPAGAGFYWAVSYLLGIVQSLITFKFWPSDKIRAEAKAKMDLKAAEKEQRATIVTVDAEGNETEKTERLSKLTQKEIRELNRKKLEAARREDAAKYGEEYKESPEDDDF